MVKFLGLTTAITIVLLTSYQLFVRYTPIGTLLNASAPVRTAPPSAADIDGGTPWTCDLVHLDP